MSKDTQSSDTAEVLEARHLLAVAWKPGAKLSQSCLEHRGRLDSVAGFAKLPAGSYSLCIIDVGTLIAQEYTAEAVLKQCQKLMKTHGVQRFVCILPKNCNAAVIETLAPLRPTFFQNPCPEDQLALTLRSHLLEQARLTAIYNESEDTAFEGLITASHSIKEIFEDIAKVAQFSTTVLIQGESGTGKELIARAIHARSPRRKKPFIAINCGAIPENLLESELFGHRKGSFTDASGDKVGLFEEAEGGTVLLDEIGELPIHLQVKLLRVLQEQAIHPIGAAQPLPIDIRIVAATLRDLEEDVESGRFREDLYYRLNVVPLHVPSLRERPEDIPVLVQHFLGKHRAKLGLSVYAISDEALNQLKAYPWPGNVRELENTLERAMILSASEQLTLNDFPSHIKAQNLSEQQMATERFEEIDSLSIKVQVRALEEMLIRKALEETNGNRTHAAKLLEISHRKLLYKLKEFELGKDED